MTSFNDDDLHRVREAIQKGWDFTQAYGIDFERLCLELLDDAIDGGEIGQQIVDLYPGTNNLDTLQKDLEALADNESGDLSAKVCDALRDAAEKLETFIDSMDFAEREAQSLLGAHS